MAKKLLCVLTLMIALVFVFASCDEQDDEKKYGGLQFNHISGGYEVSIGNCIDENIVIPDAFNGEPVISIASYGFSDSDIKTIVIPDSVTKIGNGAFDGCIWLTSITIPKSVNGISNLSFNCYRLREIEVDESNENYKSIDGVVYSKDGEKLIIYPHNKTDETFVLPDGVIEIESYAFQYNSSLRNIKFPDSVTTIGEKAFFKCGNLKKINMGDGVKSIGEFAFAYCDDLLWITLSKSLKRIEKGAFSHCDSENLKKIEIPDGTEYIGDLAFKNSFFIERVTIPKTVQYIGTDAFVYTMAEHISYDGTTSEWTAIKKGNNWSSYGDVIVTCSDGSFKY